MNINQHFEQIVGKAAEKDGDATSVIQQRDKLFQSSIVPALKKKGANDADIANAKKRWDQKTNHTMRSAGLIPAQGQSQRSFEKDKRADKAVQESVKTGSKWPIIKETIRTTADTVGNAFGQGTGSMIEGAAGFINDIGENEKNSTMAQVAKYGKDLRQGYESSASTMQKDMQAGKHGKAAQLAIGGVQSAPAMALPLGAASGVTAFAKTLPVLKGAAPYLGLGAGVAAGHTQNYGEVRRNATQNLQRDFPSWQSLQGNPEFDRRITEALNNGENLEQARVKAHADILDELSEGAADKYGAAMTALDVIAPSGAVLGSGILKKNATSKIGQVLAGGKVNSALVRQQMEAVPRVGIAKLIPDLSKAGNVAAAKMVGKQALEEGLQGAIGEYGSQAASANIGGQAVNWGKVGQSFVDEAIMGGVMGGGMQTAAGSTPHTQAKEVATEIRNQTNRLRQEEQAARQELDQAIQSGDQEAITSAQDNLKNIGAEAHKVKAMYDQHGIDTPYFVSSRAQQFEQFQQANAQAEEQADTQSDPNVAPEDLAQEDQNTPADTAAPVQPKTEINQGMADLSQAIMNSVSNGTIGLDEAEAIQRDPIRSQVFSLSTGGDLEAAHNVVMNAAAQGQLDIDQSADLISSINRYAGIKPKKTLSGIVDEHVKQQVNSAPIDNGQPQLTDFDYQPSGIEVAPEDPNLSEFNNTTPVSPEEGYQALQRPEPKPSAPVDPNADLPLFESDNSPDPKAETQIVDPVATQNQDFSQPKAFANPIRARDYIKQNGLTGTHELVTVDGQVKVQPKQAVETPADLSAASPKAVKQPIPPVDMPSPPPPEVKPVDMPSPPPPEVKPVDMPQAKPMQPEQEPEQNLNFSDKIRDAHINNPNGKAKLINDEIAKGRPRAEVLAEVTDIVKSIGNTATKPEPLAQVEPVSPAQTATAKQQEPAIHSPEVQEIQDGDIGRKSDNRPFANQQAANGALKTKGLENTHKIVQLAPSQFVIRELPKATTKEPAAPEPAPLIKNTEEEKQALDRLHSVRSAGMGSTPQQRLRYFEELDKAYDRLIELDVNGNGWHYKNQKSKMQDSLKIVRDLVERRAKEQQETKQVPGGKADTKTTKINIGEVELNIDKVPLEVIKSDSSNEKSSLNDVAKQYGRSVLDDGSITKSNGQPTGATVKLKPNGRIAVYDPSGKTLFTGPKPDSLGDFLESYWYDKKKPNQPTTEKPEDVQELDQTSGSTLEGTPSEDVPAVQGTGNPEKETTGSSRTDVSGSGRAGNAGDRSTHSMADGAREVPISTRGKDDNQGLDPKQAIVADNAPLDAFVIEGDIAKGGKKTKFKANIEAIKVIKLLEQESRPATKAEQKVLSQFVGWGGLAEAFKREDGSIAKGWDKEVAELEQLLSKEEYQAAVDSSIAAHYTSPEIVKALWSAIDQFGFKNGRVLEPSVGVGNFFGLMPKAMRKASHLHAVELDNITGAIAKNLYPEANIKAPMGFQDYQTLDNYFDVAIGNPPFSNIAISDRVRPAIHGFSLHNYFFAKSVDSLKPNGVLAMVVTNRFLDKLGDKERAYIAERAELVGAIRLPNDAFLSNAGTQVTTDIIFLRKKAEGESHSGESWTDVKNYTDKDGNQVPLNEYFVRHPENMLGDFGAYGSMYREGEPALIKREGQNTEQLLAEAVSRLPKYVFKADPSAAIEETRKALIKDISEVKVGAKFIVDGEVHERLPDVMGEQQSEVTEFANDKAKNRVMGMIQTADALAEVRKLQLDLNATDNQINAARKQLNAVYDSFTKEHGYINSDSNKRLMRDDPNWPQLAALEDNYDRGISAPVAKSTGQKYRAPSASKSAIFSKRTQKPISLVESVSNAKDALTESLNRHGYVNTTTMAELYGKSDDEIISELGDLVYEDPADGYVTKDEYLSGNVKKKLALAKEQAERDPRFERNVIALEKVIPAEIEALDIDVKAGAHWIPAPYIAEFVSHVTGSPKAKAEYAKLSNKWDITPSGISANADATYGTSRVKTSSVIEHALNGTKPTVYDYFTDGSSIINQEATLEAAQRVEMVRSAWKEWIWEDDSRREHIQQIYNGIFNTTVNRGYDGSHLAFHGMTDGIQLRPHQKNAVWRAIQSPSTLMDHTVGAGKTFTVIAAAMEMRRMGTVNKPLIVVPNHLVGQWASDFVLLYPNANILAATKKDFEKANRKKFIAKMANGDYDAIIIAHSSFSKISISPEQEQQFIDQEIADLMAFEAELREQKGSKSRNAKDIGKRRQALEEKKKNLLNRENKDTDNIYWHELGVDSIMLDEAHEFKNLEFSTSMQNVAGLGNGKGSQKAKDLFAKIQLMQGMNPKSKVIFATGTPISNTMAEMFTMQRYLDYKTLEEKGIHQFDSWAKVFGEVVSDWELSPSGKYKLTNRFAKFVNMPELMQGYLSFADVMNRDDINAQLAREGKTLGTPKLKGDKPQNIVVERSDEQADYIGVPSVDEHGFEQYPEGSLVWRTENLPRKPEKGADNMLKIMGDARKAALDMRLIDPSAADYDGSKVNEAAKRIYETYKKWNTKKGTQLVFCDLSTPKGAVASEKARIEQLIKQADQGDEAAQTELDKLSPDELSALESDFSVYDDLKAKLIAKGIKESEIAFIHDAKTELQKQQLFDKVKRGDIRVLMGSTAKMGAGMNVQNKLVALHHLDAPWRPSDLEQREGRIIRQGNEFYKVDPNGFEVEVLRYATKQTLDSRMWQTIESKAKFIEQVRKGTGTAREVEDVAGEAANAAEMKAASSGDPRILEEMDLRKKIKDMGDDKRSFERSQHRTKNIIRSLEVEIQQYRYKSELLAQDLEIKQPEKFVFKNGKEVINQEDKGAREEISKHFKSGIDNTLAKGKESPLGDLNGFKVTSRPSTQIGRVDIYLEGKSDAQKLESFDVLDGSYLGLVQKALNYIKSLPSEYRSIKNALADAQQQLPTLKAKVDGAKWGKVNELTELKFKHDALIEELKPKKKPEQQQQPEQAQEKRYSRADQLGTGNTAAQVEQVLIDRFGRDVFDSLKKKGLVKIIQTYHEKGVEGFAENGTVTLVADHLTSQSIIPTFLHELGGHVGFQGVLTENAYKNLMQDFNRLVKQNDPIALEAKRLAERESNSQVQQDEYLPYLVTVAAKAKAKAPAIQRLLNRVLSAVKAWMVGKLGLNLKLNANDILALSERMIKDIAKNGASKQTKSLRDSRNARPIYGDSVVGLWSLLAHDDAAFQLATTDKKDLVDVFMDLEDLKVQTMSDSSAKYAGVDRYWRVKMPTKGTAMVYQLNDSIWIDVSTLRQGDDGKRVYNAVANYAYNNDLVFVGDPAGLSDAAMTRRLENMISSALKLGTTKHLYPHERQSEGNALVPSLKWKVGDDIHNIKAMVMASYEATKTLYPEIDKISYNAEKDIFEGVESGRFNNGSTGGKHREFTRQDFRQLARTSRTVPDGRGSEFASSAGSTTIERAILTQTFLRTKSSQARREILDRFSLLGSQRLTDDNAILYSKQDSGRRYSRSATGNPSSQTRSKQREILDKASQTAMGQMALRNLERSKTLSGRTLNLFQTMLHKALTDESGQFKRTFDLVQDKINHVTFASSKSMDVAPSVLTQLEEGSDYLKEVKRVGRSLGHAATGGKIQKAKLDKDLKLVGDFMFENTLQEDSERHTEKQLRQLGFDEDQIKLYNEIRESIDTSLDTFAKTTFSNIYKHLGGTTEEVLELEGKDLEMHQHYNEVLKLVDKLTKNDPEKQEARKTAIESLDKVKKKAESLKDEGYVPLMRFGKYFIRVVNPTTGEVAYRQHFESESERNMAFKSFDPNKIPLGYTVESGQINELQHKLFQGVSPETVALFAKESGIPLKGAESEYIKLALKNNHALKRLLKRQGIDGFSLDVKRVLASFVLSNARYAANQTYNPAIDESITHIEDPQYQEDAIRLRDYALDTQEELAGLKNFAFVWYMGFSVMFGVVNLTQPLLQTLPYLMQYSKDYRVTGKAFGNAVKTWAMGADKMDAKYKAAYERARREGHLDPQNTWMLQGLERGKSGLGADSWQLISHSAGLFAQASETVNRRTTLFAALDVAEGLGQKKLEQLGFKDAYDFAVRSIQETQGIYNKGNRPRVARGNVGSVLMMYKQFMLAYIEQMVRMQKSGLYGGEDDEFKKKMAALVGFGVSRAVLLALGTLFAFSGFTGLPFMRDALDLVETAGGMIGKPVNTERAIQVALHDALGQTLGGAVNTVFMDGIANLNPWIDVKGRMGMGDLIPATAYFSPTTSEYQRSSEISQIGGAMGGLVEKMKEAVSLAQVGSYGMGAVQLAPKAFTSFGQGFNAAVTGDYRNTKTGVKTNDATIGQGVVKMLDAQPAEIAKQGRVRGLEMKDRAIKDYVNKRWKEKFENALDSGDPEQVKKIKAEIEEYNTQNPFYPITFNQKRAATNFEKSNQSWQEKRKNSDGLEWMDKYNPYLEEEAN